MVARRVVIRGVFLVGLAGATGLSLTGCGDESASAGGAGPATDLGPTPAPVGTLRPGATTTPRTKSDVYQRGPEQRAPRTSAPSTAPEPTSQSPATSNPAADPAAEPTAAGSRRGDDLATARQGEAKTTGRPTKAATAAPLPPGAFARTSDIPVGGGKAFKDQKVVVTQPSAGQYKGFSATCTHTGCLVDKVAEGQIICPCHGSRFSIADGAVQQGPALLPLPGEKIAVGADGSISKG